MKRDNTAEKTSVLPLIQPNLKDLTLPFGTDDIEWRVQRSGLANGRPWALVLAYVDARAVQNRLDETVGPENWTVKYHHIPGGVMCDLSIHTRNSDWVTKSDGSPETNIEAFKGGISKSLVRAASVWGIGRYLYRLTDKFAVFVDKRTNGARELRMEDKVYYWVPPALPEWALPENERHQHRELAQQHSEAHHDEPVVTAESSVLTGTTFKPEEDTFNGGYVVSFGRKHFGKKIAEIPTEEIEKYRNWLLDDARKSGKPMSERAQEFLTASEAYLNNFRADGTAEVEERVPF